MTFASLLRQHYSPSDRVLYRQVSRQSCLILGLETLAFLSVAFIACVLLIDTELLSCDHMEPLVVVLVDWLAWQLSFFEVVHSG